MSNQYNDMVIDNIIDEVVVMSRSDKVNYLRDYYAKDTVDNLDDKELFERYIALFVLRHELTWNLLHKREFSPVIKSKHLIPKTYFNTFTFVTRNSLDFNFHPPEPCTQTVPLAE